MSPVVICAVVRKRVVTNKNGRFQSEIKGTFFPQGIRQLMSPIFSYDGKKEKFL